MDAVFARCLLNDTGNGKPAVLAGVLGAPGAEGAGHLSPVKFCPCLLNTYWRWGLDTGRMQACLCGHDNSIEVISASPTIPPAAKASETELREGSEWGLEGAPKGSCTDRE